jgi:RNA polymerase sigma-70 factor (ECF subfamily)
VRGVYNGMSTWNEKLDWKDGTLSGTGREARERVEFDMPAESWRGLFRELCAGRPEAVELLYEIAAAKLFGLALWHTGSREDAGDTVQEVFVRLLQKRRRLARVRNPRVWLLTVARRAAVDLIRRRKRRAAIPLEACPFLASPGEDPERTRDAQRASALLAGLPPRQREAVYLRHYADCTFREMGRIAGVSTFTAAARYRLGVRKLRILMEKKR